MSDTVSVISGLTNKVVATVKVGSGISFAAFDPKDEEVYIVLNFVSNFVSVISSSTHKVIAVVYAGSFYRSDSAAFNPVNSEVYTSNGEAGAVSAISS